MKAAGENASWNTQQSSLSQISQVSIEEKPSPLNSWNTLIQLHSKQNPDKILSPCTESNLSIFSSAYWLIHTQYRDNIQT